MGEQLTIFEEKEKKPPKVVNVASVPQRSPFRYPGGKTWLVPTVRKWLKQEPCEHLIEPFVGGGIVSLSAAFENLAKQVTMVELDEEVASVWKIILSEENKWLTDKILNFDLTPDNANIELSKDGKQTKDTAFCTILKNRIFHGGILAKGSGMIKNAINHVKHKIDFYQTDAFKFVEENLKDEKAWFFIDPPYTIAGKRLYTHFDIDHEELFYLTSEIRGKFMLTYNDTKEIRTLVDKYGLQFRTIPMKTTHHLQKHEIIIADNFEWWE